MVPSEISVGLGLEPLDVMLTCVRWYVAYPLSLRHIEEIMAERVLSQ